MEIKKFLQNFLKLGPVSVSLAVILSVLFVTGLVSAATTISTNIATDGTLTVTGAINASSTLATSGNITVTAGYALDTAGAGILNIGTTTATTINIGRSGQVAALLGNATVAGTLGVTGDTTLASTTATSFKVGQIGTQSTLMLSGTCSLVSDVLITATSTGTGTCAATGAAANDKVFISLATTTTKMAAQWEIIGTVAGSGSITVRLLNLTGADAVPSATNGLGSSTQYWIVR